jgi:DNA-binding beta-propeller fold protein YncE
MKLTSIPFGVLVSAFAAGCSSGGHEEGGGTFTSIPNPALVIANGGSETISIIDPATMTVVSELPARSGMNPHHISISPDRSRVLITAPSADLAAGHAGGGHGGGHGGSAASTTVYLIEVGSRVMREVITVDATAHNAAFTRDGASIVLGMMEQGMIAGYDATANQQRLCAGGRVRRGARRAI